MLHFFRRVSFFILGNKFLVAMSLAASVAFLSGYSVRDLARSLVDVATSVSVDVPTKARVEAGFSVSDGAMSMSSRVIQSAAASVDILGLGSGGPDIAPAILSVMSRGIRARVLVDAQSLQGPSSSVLLESIGALKARGAEVRILSAGTGTQETIVVTDGLHVCSGTIKESRPSRGAVFAIWNMPDVGAAYRQHFVKLWETSLVL